MPDPEITSAPKAGAVTGIDKPFTGKDVNRDGIDDETGFFLGVSPDNNQRITVNLAAMKAQFGDKAGFDKYKRIAVAGRFFNPDAEPVGSDFFPDLQLEGMKSSIREKVDAILNETTKE